MGLTPRVDSSSGTGSGGGGGGIISGGQLYQHIVELTFNNNLLSEIYNTETDINLQGKMILSASFLIVGIWTDVYYEIRTWDLNKIYIPNETIKNGFLNAGTTRNVFFVLHNPRHFALYVQGGGLFRIVFTLTDEVVTLY